LDEPVGFKPGDFVTVQIEEPELTSVARIPATAINAAQEVLVVGDEERLEVVQVTLLRRQGDVVLIRVDGGFAGRLVVAERTPVLGAGIKVKTNQEGDGQEQQAPAAPAMIELSAERKARIVAFVEANSRMPADVKKRILAQLEQPEVPAQMVERIEGRMGG